MSDLPGRPATKGATWPVRLASPLFAPGAVASHHPHRLCHLVSSIKGFCRGLKSLLLTNSELTT